MIVGNDQGVSVSVNRGWTWHRSQIAVAQMYHVTADNAVIMRMFGVAFGVPFDDVLLTRGSLFSSPTHPLKSKALASANPPSHFHPVEFDRPCALQVCG